MINQDLARDSDQSEMQGMRPELYRVKPLMEAICVALLILGATFSTTYFIYLRALSAQEGEIRQGLLRTANVAASIIDPDIHQSITSASDEATERYQSGLAPLVRMQNSDPQIAYLYTAIKKGDTYHFIYDTTPSSSESAVAAMQIYEDASENGAFLRAFETKKTTTSDEAYTDQYGSFISGYVPLKDKNGNFYGVLGMDIDIKDYEKRLSPIRRATTRALVAGFFIAFLMASAIWFLRNFILVLNTKRIRIYDIAVKNLGLNGTKNSNPAQNTHASEDSTP